MTLALVTGALVGLLATVILVCLTLKISTAPLDPGPVEFRIDKYRPLNRLLLERDIEFLVAQPGYRPELVRKLRRSRRQVLRLYLRELSRDFDRAYLAAKLALLESSEDRPELIGELLRRRLLFRYSLAIAYGRLALEAIGLGGMDPRRLWAAVESAGSYFQAAAPLAAREA